MRRTKKEKRKEGGVLVRWISHQPHGDGTERRKTARGVLLLLFLPLLLLLLLFNSSIIPREPLLDSSNVVNQAVTERAQPI